MFTLAVIISRTGMADHLANIISSSRLAAGVALLIAAWAGAPRAALAFLGYALFSDVVDGRVARALGTVSERGARIDSLADALIYLTMPVVGWLLFPQLRATETVSCVLVFVAYATPVAYGFAKYGRLTSYHTTAAKISGACLSVTFFVWLATRVAWPFHMAIGLLVLSALEEMAITRTLPVWRADVPSLRVARQARQAGQAGAAIGAPGARRGSAGNGEEREGALFS